MDVILDTNAVSAVLRGDPGLGELLTGADRHHLPVIVIGEYRYGLLRSARPGRLEALLEALVRESIVLLVDETTAATYAALWGRLREAGTPIPQNDAWIAALALQHGEPIVSRDRHFDAVHGLTRLTW